MAPEELKPQFTTYDGPVHPEARAKEAYVESMFDSVSGTYDLANRLMSFGLDVMWRHRLVREAGVKAGDPVLDVGCGTGDLLIDFAQRAKGIVGTGIDFSAGMLEQAKKKDKFGMAWTQGSALELPFQADQYQAVSMAWVLRSITDPQRCFAEMARVARPGGRVLCLELTRPTAPLSRLIYWPLLNIYVPVVGTMLSGHKDGYKYLRDSIKSFYEPDTVLDFMRQAGLKNVRALPLTLGVATLFMGEK
jgi:demethylmenaquinone methyltransferase/2-methoxy-6-polyprenyl-1,4-benzoquinol methylase